MLDAGEAADVRADFGEQLHHHRDPQAVDAGQIHARPVGQPLPHVVLHAGLAAGAGLAQGRPRAAARLHGHWRGLCAQRNLTPEVDANSADLARMFHQ